MTKVKNGIHDKTIDTLIKRLEEKGNYDTIEKNIMLWKDDTPSQSLTEIDVKATHISGTKPYMILAEIKSYDSSNARKRMYKQLELQKTYESKKFKGRIFTFYVTPKKYGELNIEWIR